MSLLKKNLLNGLKKCTALMAAACMLLSGIAWDGLEGLFAQPAIRLATAEETEVTAGETRGTNNLDGSKIEGIHVEWVTQDSLLAADGAAAPETDKAHLFLSTTSTNKISMIYRIEVELSGQYDYKPGDITISIPAQVFHARTFDENGVGLADENRLHGSLELPMPEAPST